MRSFKTSIPCFFNTLDVSPLLLFNKLLKVRTHIMATKH